MNKNLYFSKKLVMKIYDIKLKKVVEKTPKQFEAAQKFYKGRFTEVIPKDEPLPKVEKVTEKKKD